MDKKSLKKRLDNVAEQVRLIDAKMDKLTFRRNELAAKGRTLNEEYKAILAKLASGTPEGDDAKARVPKGPQTSGVFVSSTTSAGVKDDLKPVNIEFGVKPRAPRQS